MTLEEEVIELRKLLWTMHGHGFSALYGDDGEMQCQECFQRYGFYDWKRTPIEDIMAKIEEGNLKKITGNKE